jgi:hypothetical protein
VSGVQIIRKKRCEPRRKLPETFALQSRYVSEWLRNPDSEFDALSKDELKSGKTFFSVGLQYSLSSLSAKIDIRRHFSNLHSPIARNRHLEKVISADYPTEIGSGPTILSVKSNLGCTENAD